MEDIFKNKAYKILEIFIEFPNHDFSIRGIARELKLSHVTIMKHIIDLEKENLIIKKKETLYPTYYANTENSKYKFYKKNYIISKLNHLVDYLQKETLPSSIILFGSMSKGTFTKTSDIDIFVESKETKLNLTKYEKELKKKINILFESNINELSEELRNNIINGEILYGFVRIKCHEK